VLKFGFWVKGQVRRSPTSLRRNRTASSRPARAKYDGRPRPCAATAQLAADQQFIHLPFFTPPRSHANSTCAARGRAGEASRSRPACSAPTDLIPTVRCPGQALEPRRGAPFPCPGRPVQNKTQVGFWCGVAPIFCPRARSPAIFFLIACVASVSPTSFAAFQINKKSFTAFGRVGPRYRRALVGSAMHELVPRRLAANHTVSVSGDFAAFGVFSLFF